MPCKQCLERFTKIFFLVTDFESSPAFCKKHVIRANTIVTYHLYLQTFRPQSSLRLIVDKHMEMINVL